MNLWRVGLYGILFAVPIKFDHVVPLLIMIIRDPVVKGTHHTASEMNEDILECESH
jgi:hypothetical protein